MYIYIHIFQGGRSKQTVRGGAPGVEAAASCGVVRECGVGNLATRV
jgi:hypothetical protein